MVLPKGIGGLFFMEQAFNLTILRQRPRKANFGYKSLGRRRAVPLKNWNKNRQQNKNKNARHKNHIY